MDEIAVNLTNEVAAKDEELSQKTARITQLTEVSDKQKCLLESKCNEVMSLKSHNEGLMAKDRENQGTVERLEAQLKEV